MSCDGLRLLPSHCNRHWTDDSGLDDMSEQGAGKIPGRKDEKLIIFWREFVIDIPYKADPHLGGVIPPQHVADEVCLDLHLDHL